MSPTSRSRRRGPASGARSVRHVGTGILDLRRSVGERQTRIGAIENLLAAMQSRPGDGDPERVAALIAALLQQQALLASDLVELGAFTEEFTAECPPWPDICIPATDLPRRGVRA